MSELRPLVVIHEWARQHRLHALHIILTDGSGGNDPANHGEGERPAFGSALSLGNDVPGNEVCASFQTSMQNIDLAGSEAVTLALPYRTNGPDADTSFTPVPQIITRGFRRSVTRMFEALHLL